MKRIFKLLIISICLVMILVPLFAACDDESNSKSPAINTKGDKLVVYNWEEYVDYDNLKGFKEYYKNITGREIDVIYTTFDTNETMVTKVLKNDCNVDLICPSEYAVERLMRANKLYSFKETEDSIRDELNRYNITLENLHGNLEPKILEAIDKTFSSIPANGVNSKMSEYISPYMWGTLGIMYNTEKVSKEELDEGWGLLWNRTNNPELENKILIKDSIRDAYACGVLYMKQYGTLPKGYENMTNVELINCTDQVLMDACEKVLTEQREHISGYEVDFGKEDMLNELSYLSLAWSGDAMWAISESYQEDKGTYLLDYYVPEIGGNIWYDGWVIPKTIENKLAALMFMDYMAMPEHAILNQEAIGYTSAVAKAKMKASQGVKDVVIGNGYTVDEYFNDIRRYPNLDDEKTMNSLAVMSDYGPKNEDIVQMWERVKAGGKVDLSLIWITIGLILFILLMIGIYFLSQALKLRPRKIKSEENSKIKV